MPRTVPSASADPGALDPDHHLWRNGRLYWVAFTVHLPGWQKERVRLSLGTADVAEARSRRDALLRRYPEARGCALSLRIAGRSLRGGQVPPMSRLIGRPQPGEGCAA